MVKTNDIFIIIRSTLHFHHVKVKSQFSMIKLAYEIHFLSYNDKEGHNEWKTC